MVEGNYLIGIDSGTSGIKAVIFDLNGNELYQHREVLDGITPYEDWYEEDMDVIWEKCCVCLECVLKNIDAEQVLGIGLTAQGDGLWMIDQDGKPVRNGICFCDGRTGEEITRWNEDGTSRKAFDICGTAVFGSAIPAEIKWLEKHEPETIEKAVVFFRLKDWLFYKLTGVISSDDTDMSIPMLNAKTKQYDERLFQLFGVDQYKEKFPKVSPTKDNRAEILGELAEKWGISKKAIVIGGPMDIPACALGSGAIRDGQASTTIGTAAIHSVIMDEPRPEPYMAGMTIVHCCPGRWIRLVSSLGGSPNLEWFLKNIGGELKKEAREQGKDIYDYCSEVIDKIPIGSNGVVYHPYIMPGGERAPFFKNNIKASFSGISFNTKPGDMLRAVYEGVAMAMLDCYASVPTQIKELYISGGGAKSDVWTQMFSDALGTEVFVAEGDEFGAKGAALNVGVSLGIYKDYEDAVEKTVRIKKRFVPDMKRHERYQKLFRLYKKGYELSMDWWDMRSEFLKEEA